MTSRMIKMYQINLNILWQSLLKAKIIYILGRMKQRSAFKPAVVKQYQGPTEFFEEKMNIPAARQRNNFRNYFYAQKHRSTHQRPSSSVTGAGGAWDRVKYQKQQSPPKNYVQNETGNLGMIKPFFINIKPGIKPQGSGKMAKNTQAGEFANQKLVGKGETSAKCLNFKRGQVYEQIVSDMNEYFSTVKLSSYKKKQKRPFNAPKKNQCLEQQQDFIKECQSNYSDNLNVRGLRPSPFWNQSLPKRRNSEKTKLNTEQLMSQQPQSAIIKYRSNFIGSPTKKMTANSSQFSITDRQNSARRISSTSLRKNRIQQTPKINRNRNVQYFGKIRPQMNIDQIQLLKIKYYKDFIWKIWFNNDYKTNSEITPKYFVGKGNNSKLIRSIMSKRWWWKAQTKQENSNFIWTQLKVYSVYQTQQSLPQFTKFQQGDSAIWNTEKKKSHYNKNSFLLTKAKYEIWQQYLSVNKRSELKSSINLQSRKILQKNLQNPQEAGKKPIQISNHLQYSRMIGNKKALYKTMTMYQQLLNKPNTCLPLTYHITSGLEDQQYLRFLNQYYHRAKKTNNTNWIVKPGEMSNRGNGITVCKELPDIKAIIKNKKCHNNGKPFTYIIQQYLDKPFLYYGRKFDVRHYLMITSINGRIQAYFYEEGYVRTTSYKYNVQTQKASVHLTNDAVQKYCKDYGKYQQGNKISYEQLENYLKSKYHGKYSFYETILPQIRQISIQLVNSCYYLIDPKRRAHNFEIFGLDIMIDQNFKPWLIQVNTNPCLELSSKLLAKLIPKMLDNAFMIVLDPLFPPPADILTRRFNTLDNCINENKFQLIFDEAVDGKKLNEVYAEADKQINQMDGFASDQEAYESAQDCADF